MQISKIKTTTTKPVALRSDRICVFQRKELKVGTKNLILETPKFAQQYLKTYLELFQENNLENHLS